MRIARVAEVAATIFTSHGLRVNFAKGQTEVMLALRGSNAKAVSTELLIECDGGWSIPVHGPSENLRVVAAYKRMGGVMTPSGSMVAECRRRAGESSSAFKPIRTRLFASHFVERHTRKSLAKSLLFSRLLYNCGTWSHLSSKALRSIRSPYMSVFRVIYGMCNNSDSDKHYTDREVLKEASEPEVHNVVRFNRLRYLLRLFKHDPTTLIRMTILMSNVPSSWAGLLVQDFMFLWQSFDEVHTSMPDPSLEPLFWLKDVCANPIRWRLRFSKLLTMPLELSPAPAAVQEDSHTCYSCGRSFPTIQQMLTHAHNMHNYVNQLHLRIFTNQCLACGLFLRSKKRVFLHLSRKPAEHSCHAYYLANIDPMTHDQYVECKRCEVKPRSKLPSLTLPAVQL